MMIEISKFVTFVLVNIFIFCTGSLAISKKWEEFHSKNSVKMFFESKTLTGKSIRKVVVMINFKKSRTASDGKKIKSIRMIQNYDCTTSRFRLRSAINYSEEFLKGQEVSRGNEVTPWRIVPEGTPYGKLMKKICD
jgi:hypothetical protein